MLRIKWHFDPPPPPLLEESAAGVDGQVCEEVGEWKGGVPTLTMTMSARCSYYGLLYAAVALCWKKHLCAT